MYYFERETVIYERHGRIVRREQKYYIKEDGTGRTCMGSRYLPEDEYYLRKAIDSMHRGCENEIREAYRDYKTTFEWD